MITYVLKGEGCEVFMTSRQPIISLDQWAYSEIASRSDWHEEFFRLLDVKGTLALSWMNAAEIACTQGDNNARITAFVDRVAERWLLIDVSPKAVIAREAAGVRNGASPQLDLDLLRGYFPSFPFGRRPG